MKICEPGDSAFPTQVPWELRDKDGNISIVQHNWHGGLTKREYFAGQALIGIVYWDATVNNGERPTADKLIAEQAVALADALIDELNKEGT